MLLSAPMSTWEFLVFAAAAAGSIPLAIVIAKALLVALLAAMVSRDDP
jgi:hypothetical protein